MSGHSPVSKVVWTLRKQTAFISIFIVQNVLLSSFFFCEMFRVKPHVNMMFFFSIQLLHILTCFLLSLFLT